MHMRNRWPTAYGGAGRMASQGQPAGKQKHIVAVAPPMQGHLNSVMRFCKLLLHHRSDALVTFVDIDPVPPTAAQEVANHGPPADPTGPPALDDAGASSGRIGRARIPVQGIDLSNDFHLSFRSFFDALHIGRPLHDLILRLNRTGPPVTHLVCDFTITLHTQHAVDQLGIPRVVLYPFSASRLLLLYYVMREERVSMDTVHKALETASTRKDVFCEGLRGLPTLFNIDIPHFKHVGDDSQFMWDLGVQALKICNDQAHSVVVNTFDKLEASALEALSKVSSVPVYAMGPLIQPLHTESSTSFWKEDNACIAWLHHQPPSSVLYISFGSIAVLSQAQFQELLEGLVASERRFLWSFRRGLVEDGAYASLSSIILAKSHGRGFVVDWAPQLKILANPSVSGFLTHCGWNSVIESIAYGVPMLCWPYFADQPINARCIVDMWKLGLQFEVSGDNLQFIERKEVERVIKSLMGGLEGEVVRENIAIMKKACDECLSQNGSSYKNVTSFI